MIQNWIIFDGSEHYSDIPCGSEIPNAGTQPGTHDQYAPGTGAATKFAPGSQPPLRANRRPHADLSRQTRKTSG